MKAGIHCKKGIEIMYDVDVMVKYRDQFYHECSDIVERSHVYRNHINKFIEYLSQPEVNLVDSPTMIDKHTVEDCIGYYHEKGEINTRATMESHLESLKKFYIYLSETGKSKDIFAKITNYGEFKNNIVINIAFPLSEYNGAQNAEGYRGAEELVYASGNYVSDEDPGFVSYADGNFEFSQDASVPVESFPNIRMDSFGTIK